jgi:hypothetical protein
VFYFIIGTDLNGYEIFLLAARGNEGLFGFIGPHHGIGNYCIQSRLNFIVHFRLIGFIRKVRYSGSLNLDIISIIGIFIILEGKDSSDLPD